MRPGESVFNASHATLAHLTTMQYDEKAALAKRKQLLAAAALGTVGPMLTEEVRLRLVNAFANVTPPEAPQYMMRAITIDSLFDLQKARSRKPGNVVLNWRKLFDIVPDAMLAGLGAATLPVAPPVVIALAGLYIWNRIWRGAVEEFSDIEAVTILALWRHRSDENKISESEGFERVNELRACYALPPLTAGQYASAINRLLNLNCIEIQSGVIWLRERIQVQYP